MDLTTIEVNPTASDLANQGTPPGSPPWRLGRKRSRAIGIGLFSLFAVAFVLFLGFRGKTTLAPRTPTESAQASDSGRKLRLKGVTEAIRMRAILAPVLAGQFVAPSQSLG